MKMLEYQINTDCPSWPVLNQIVINTVNPHSYCIAKKDAVFRMALQKSDFLMPDGIGIVLALRYLRNNIIKRVPGADIHDHLLKEAKNNKLKVFYLGSNNKTLNLIKTRIKEDYPSIKVKSFSPPFKQEFSEKDNKKMISVINDFEPHILFVGMTAPKQEKWVYEQKDFLNTTIIASIGAVFDFYSGNVKRAPNWMISIGMEWLYRFVKEPKRMWRRYLVNNYLFIWYVIQGKVNSNN